MKTRIKTIKSLILFALILSLSPHLLAGNKEIMSRQAAKVIAERGTC